MKPFCEVMVKNIFPAIRALLAEELMVTLNHTQNETARLMGVTQPAISQYRRELRGRKVAILKDNSSVCDLIGASASMLARRTDSRKHDFMCEICRKIRDEDLASRFRKEAGIRFDQTGEPTC